MELPPRHQTPSHKLRGPQMSSDNQSTMSDRNKVFSAFSTSFVDQNQPPMDKHPRGTLPPSKTVVLQAKDIAQLQKAAQSQGSSFRVHPLNMIQEAANRVNASNESKQQKISRLELEQETLHHLQRQNALHISEPDGLKKGKNYEERLALTQSKVAKNGEKIMSMHPNRFNTSGWAFKQLSDTKLRSEHMEDHLNGRYCNRDLSSQKDKAHYTPNKVFTTMYKKAYDSLNSLEVGQGGGSVPREGPYKGNKFDDRKSQMSQTFNVPKGKQMIDLINKSHVLAVDRDIVTCPRNEYAPDFTTSLNFAFNNNDIFGPRAKKSAAMQLLKKKQYSTESLNDPLKSRNGTSRQELLLKAEQSSKTYNDNNLKAAEEEFNIRKQLNSQILSNQYSFWAGMYVKRMSAALPGDPSEGLDFAGGRNTIELGRQFDTVPFGDPRSLTQCLNFSRKKLPYMPEQEIKSGGGVKLIGPPPRKGHAVKLKVRGLASKKPPTGSQQANLPHPLHSKIFFA